MGTLSVVATPIGNLKDITLRALETLQMCDVVFCEDTRVAGKLLSHYEISKPFVRCDAEMEGEAGARAVEILEEGKHIVYISDAGTPGISDPGSRLVAFVRMHAPSATIEAIPGPSALGAVLSIAGINMNEFLFLGFLPHKKGRQTALKKIATSEYPVVLYESPHRIIKLLEELDEFVTECRVSIGRELTKMHEELLQGSSSELRESLMSRDAVRGEFVVIVEHTRLAK